MDSTRSEIEQKYGKEAYVNMDRLATFMIRMIKKYGTQVLEELDEEDKRINEREDDDNL